MTFLIISKNGDSLGLALALEREGHDGAIAISKSDAQRVGEGLLTHVTAPVAWAREHADLVLYDMVGFGDQADALRDLGVPVFGASAACDHLELDRIFGLKLFKALGLTIPETEFFPDVDFDRAIAHVRRDGGRWVFKPCGNLGTDQTLVGEDAEELIESIERERDTAKGSDVKYPAFCLQRFVSGVEVSVERCYSDGLPVPGLDTMTFEEKKFLAGNLGPAVGCMGNIVADAPAALVAATVAHMDRWARAHRLTSFLDLNSILDERTGVPYVLEPTARFGYDALWAALRRWQMPLGETFQALAEGTIPRVATRSTLAAAVRVSVPPYPSGDPKQARGVPVVDDILDDPALWPGDVYLTEEGDLEVSGADAVVYIVTALGTTPERAYRGCYDWLATARLPNRQYRVDLLDRVAEALPRVHRWYGERKDQRVA